MIIRDLVVSGVGRFGAPTRLTGFAPGLNVLSAPNEAGKSTLFKALRTCLFQRHGSEHAAIRELATLDSALPVNIAVSFSVDGREYAIRKSFLRSKSAVLTRDGVEHARGAKADELVWELLGVTPGSGRAQIDTGSFGLLWVEQSQSFQPPVASDGARDVLTGIIASEVGALLGGERARGVLEEVAAALAERETKTGAPKAGGPLKAALDEAERLRAQETTLLASRAELEAEFEALARARGELARLSDPRREAELRTSRDEARRAREEARAAAARLQTLALEVEAARAVHAGAEQRLAAAQEARDRLDEAKERLERLEAEAAQAAEREKAAETRAREATEAAAEAEAALARAGEALRRHAASAEAREARRRLAVWLERREELNALTRRLVEIDAALARNLATPERIKAARAAHELAIGLEARLDAQAARLEIRLEPGAAGAVAVDGETVGDGFAKALRGRTRIAVAGVGEIAVTPADAGAQQERELAQARLDLKSALAATGCASVAQAMEALDAARASKTEAENLRRRIEAIASEAGGGDASQALDRRIAAAEAAIAAAGPDAQGSASDEDDDRSRETRDGLDEARAAAARARDAAEAAKARAREEFVAERTRRASLTASVDEQRRRVERALAEARARSDEDAPTLRAQELAEAARRLEALSGRHAAEAAATPGPDQLALREARVERLEQALDNHLRELDRLGHDVRSREEIVRRLGADGLDERLARVEQERALAERELARAQRSTDALRLLRDEIAATLAEGRARFVAPVMENLRPYLGALFPGAEIEIGDDFSPARIMRANADERFDLLSDGTREQIAILVRLALGAMLAKSGRPAPIILDDALVFSDDARIETMFDALARAARNQQVIVLTCRSRAFAPIGGASLRIEPA